MKIYVNENGNCCVLGQQILGSLLGLFGGPLFGCVCLLRERVDGLQLFDQCVVDQTVKRIQVIN